MYIAIRDSTFLPHLILAKKMIEYLRSAGPIYDMIEFRGAIGPR